MHDDAVDDGQRDRGVGELVGGGAQGVDDEGGQIGAGTDGDPSGHAGLAARPRGRGRVLSDYDRVAALLRRAGVPVGEVMLWITVFDCYAVGAALDIATPDDVWRSEGGDVPALDEALRAAPRGRRRADEAFEIGLEALLAGLRERLGCS